ncbi:MAG: DUF4168 domain-containing protein [Loktanella sp.]|nr:DUF4168 domain-containing protein [Loktanella sp.]
MTIQKHISAIALVGLMAGTTPVAAFAQAQQPAPQIEEVTGEDVDAFVIAYRDVQAIDAEYGAQMAQTTDEAELQTLQQEAQMKVSEAVEAAPDIDMERFIEILTVAQSDPEVGTEITEKLAQ